MTHTCSTVKDKSTTQSAINNDSYTLNGQRRFRYGSCQHHLPFSIPRRHNRPALLLRRKVSIKRKNLCRKALQQFCATHYLRLPRQKNKNIAILRCPTDCICNSLRHVFTAEILLRINNINRKHPPSTLNEWSLQRITNCRTLYSGRHYHKTQIGTQELLRLSAKSKSKVGMQASLMKFIEDNDAYTVERRVMLQHARQNTFGQNLYSGIAAYASLKTNAITNGLANRFVKQRRHTFSNLPCCKTTWLEHQNPSLYRRIQKKSQRQERRFARSRRSGNNHILLQSKRPTHCLGNGSNRQMSRTLNKESLVHLPYYPLTARQKRKNLRGYSATDKAQNRNDRNGCIDRNKGLSHITIDKIHCNRSQEEHVHQIHAKT